MTFNKHENRTNFAHLSFLLKNNVWAWSNHKAPPPKVQPLTLAKFFGAMCENDVGHFANFTLTCVCVRELKLGQVKSSLRRKGIEVFWSLGRHGHGGTERTEVASRGCYESTVKSPISAKVPKTDKNWPDCGSSCGRGQTGPKPLPSAPPAPGPLQLPAIFWQSEIYKLTVKVESKLKDDEDTLLQVLVRLRSRWVFAARCRCAGNSMNRELRELFSINYITEKWFRLINSTAAMRWVPMKILFPMPASHWHWVTHCAPAGNQHIRQGNRWIQLEQKELKNVWKTDRQQWNLIIFHSLTVWHWWFLWFLSIWAHYICVFTCFFYCRCLLLCKNSSSSLLAVFVYL